MNWAAAWHEVRLALKKADLDNEWRQMSTAALEGHPEQLDVIDWVLSVYKADEETLNFKEIDVDGTPMRLTPGMGLIAEIKTARRRVVEYLLSPIQRAKQESLKERQMGKRIISIAMKICTVILVLGVLLGVYFLPNIRGYQEFRELCRTQAGAHVDEKLKSQRGWEVLDTHPGDATIPLEYPGVAFVRYQERDGQRYDLVRIPQTRVGGPWYQKQPADMSQVPRYQFQYRTFEMPSPTLLGQTRYEVIDLEKKKRVFLYQEFAYSKFKPENTILGATSTERCPDDVYKIDPKTGKRIPTLKERAFASAFEG